MVKINDFDKIIPFVDKIQSDTVYPRSIIECVQPGEIWADDPENIQFCMLRHRCGFAYISGEYDWKIISEIRKIMISYEEKTGGRIVLNTENDENFKNMILSFPDILMTERYTFAYEGTTEIPPLPGINFTLEEINSDNYSLLSGRITPKFSWESKNEFLDKGFGFCILNGREFVSCAYSAAMCEKYADIGVETNEKYRGKGFGKIVSAAMAKEIVRRNKIPVWQCSAENNASMGLACSVGFTLTGKHPLFTFNK